MITMSEVEFAARLKTLGLTSQQAARALGVSQRLVFYYLSGEVPVDAPVAILLRTKTALAEAIEKLNDLDPGWPAGSSRFRTVASFPITPPGASPASPAAPARGTYHGLYRTTPPGA